MNETYIVYRREDGYDEPYVECAAETMEDAETIARYLSLQANPYYGEDRYFAQRENVVSRHAVQSIREGRYHYMVHFTRGEEPEAHAAHLAQIHEEGVNCPNRHFTDPLYRTGNVFVWAPDAESAVVLAKILWGDR